MDLRIVLGVLAVCLLASCGSSPAVSGPDELDSAIRETSDYLNEKIEPGILMAVLSIKTDYPPLSEYIIDGLTANIVNDGLFTVVDRQRLDEIRAEQDFQMSGEVDDRSAQEIGRILGAKTIIVGSVSPLGNLWRLSVRALDVESAQVQGLFNRNIPTGDATITALTSGPAVPIAGGSYSNRGGNAAQTEAGVQSATPALQTTNQETHGVSAISAPGIADNRDSASQGGGQMRATTSPVSVPSAAPPVIPGAASVNGGAPAGNGTAIPYERFTPLRTLNSDTIGGFSNLDHNVAFTSDSKGILTYDFRSYPRYVRLWDVETGKVIRNIREFSMGFSLIAVSPDGRRFVTDIKGGGNKILLWDLTAGAYRESTGHRESIRSLAFSPSGNTFASGSGDKTIKIWDAETGQEIQTLTGHTGTGSIGAVLSVAYSPNGQQILSCSNDETIKLWDTVNGTILRSIPVPKGTGPGSLSVSLIAYSPDGRKIAAVQGNRIRIFDAQTGGELFTLSDATGPLSFSPDGSRLLSFRNTSGGGRNIVIWNMDTGWEIGRLNIPGGGHGTVSLVMSPDGKYFAIGEQEKSVTIWGEE
ncbi:MAG: hypothetical protein LBB83_02080 [Treponema sp.]|jgi:hypothetical protein|nr:hypothetical protein [Treponema sp.]